MTDRRTVIGIFGNVPQGSANELLRVIQVFKQRHPDADFHLIAANMVPADEAAELMTQVEHPLAEALKGRSR